MKPIEGVDLATLMKDTEAEIVAARRRELMGVVGGIISDLDKWEAEKKRHVQEMVKLDDKISKAADKLTKIRDGDWAALELPKSANPADKAQQAVATA